MLKTSFFTTVFALSCFVASASQLVVNGDFATGDFTGWSAELAENDDNHNGSAVVESKVGILRYLATDTPELAVGRIAQEISAVRGGVLRYTLGGELYGLTGSFSAPMPTLKKFSLVGNDVILPTHEYVYALPAGSLPDITFTMTVMNTPSSTGKTSELRVSNVSFTQFAVPEPASWVMGLCAAAGFVHLTRRRKLLQ